jgi:uncharacterized RDD family membrane protein YckC
MGTPLFASPEQIRKEPLDHRTDVYSVAATLYYLLTGQAPHQTGDMAATMIRAVSEPAPTMRTLRPGISPALDAVVLKGLERSRDERYQDLEEFRQALLPFVSRPLSIGGMGLRFGAFVIDFVVFAPLGAVIYSQLAHQLSALPTSVLSVLFLDIPWVLYFILLEGLWGCSLGKRCLRLRVSRADANQLPGLGRVLLRTAVFYAVTALPTTILSFIFPEDDTVGSLLFLLVLAIGTVVLIAPMRARNGYRGLHEWLSGTRLVRLPWVKKRRPFPTEELVRTVVQRDELPERLGSFEVQGAMRWDGEAKLLLGQDVVLGRQVWIWLRPLSEPTLGAARREINRTTRPRWLAGGRHEQLQWDAFLAPVGCSLPRLLAREQRLPWSEVRPLLEQLTEELVEACRGGTLPATVGVEQVWVQPDGRVQLLDLPPGGAPPEDEPPVNGPDQGRALGLLAQVAALTLEGHTRAPAQTPTPIRAPLPEHATALLNRLLGVEGSYQTVEQVQAEMAELHDRPTEITRGIRVGQLALAATLVYAGLSILFAVAGQMLREDQPLDLENGLVLCLVPAVWVAWAFGWRGGYSLRLMGLSLVRRDGRKASRLQCALRSLILWTPVAALLLLAIDLNARHPGWHEAKDKTVGLLFVSLFLGAAVLPLLYAVLALVFPRRSFHDWLAGTYPVPR